MFPTSSVWGAVVFTSIGLRTLKQCDLPQPTNRHTTRLWQLKHSNLPVRVSLGFLTSSFAGHLNDKVQERCLVSVLKDSGDDKPQHCSSNGFLAFRESHDAFFPGQEGLFCKIENTLRLCYSSLTQLQSPPYDWPAIELWIRECQWDIDWYWC